jgi:thiol-disulfide isomerase/thioredoxin
MPKRQQLLQHRLLVIALIFLCGCIRREGLNPGDNAPRIALPFLVNASNSENAGEKVVIPETHLGKVQLINFWASWCEPCIAELPSLERLQALRRDKLVVIGIGIDDDVPSLLKVKSQSGTSFVNLFDRGGKAKSKYEVRGVPESFLIGKDGRMILIRDLFKGDELTVRILGPREWDSSAMLAEIDQLLSR